MEEGGKRGKKEKKKKKKGKKGGPLRLPTIFILISFILASRGREKWRKKRKERNSTNGNHVLYLTSLALRLLFLVSSGNGLGGEKREGKKREREKRIPHESLLLRLIVARGKGEEIEGEKKRGREIESKATHHAIAGRSP